MKVSASLLKPRLLLLHRPNHAHHRHFLLPPPKISTSNSSSPSSISPKPIAAHSKAPSPPTKFSKHAEKKKNHGGSLIVPRWVVVGGVSFGVAAAVVMLGGQEAMAMGPEGPMVEEFWDNVRRYGLYALTVSTGAIYSLLEPIFELLKNPLTAVLLIVVLGGAFFIVSQVLSAMVGISEFSYNYSY